MIRKFFATAAKGMEPLLLEEIQALGAQDIQSSVGGVAFQGTLETAYKVCLLSRVASRVLMPISEFGAPTPEKLYGGVRQIRWSQHMRPDQTLAVDFTSIRSAITHTQFGAQKTKDAVVDQFQSIAGSRPSVDLARPDLRLNIYLKENHAILSIDLSGDGLHRRGYRQQDTGAPLRESLAAAILLHAGWPKIAEQGGGLIDPMCGSATLPIEAGLMATQTAPGLNRDYFGFLGWLQHDAPAWERLKAEAQSIREQRMKKPLPPIAGFDEDFRAIHGGIQNVERAGMRGIVHLEKRELNLTQPLSISSPTAQPRGIFIVNPPYGERMGEEEALGELYTKIGDTLKQKFKGWEGYVFTGSPELSKKIGLKASKRIVLFNGPIECRLFKFELY